MCLNGAVRLICDTDEVHMKMGETVLVPACFNTV